MKKLEQISARMDELEKQVEELKGQRGAKDDRANLEKELFDLMEITLEEPAGLRKRVEVMRLRFGEYEDAKRALSGGNLRLVVSIMWTGMRMVRAWSAMARVIACRIHHVA